MIDNYDIWQTHQDRIDSELSLRPVCSCCENHIQEDHYYEVEDKVICPDCLETHFRKELD